MQNSGMPRENLALCKMPAGPAGRYGQLGGTLQMISSNTTEEERAAIFKWIEYQNYTPKLDEERFITDLEMRSKEGKFIFAKEMTSVWELEERDEAVKRLSALYVNVDMRDFENYNMEGITLRTEPPACAQQLYSVLDGCYERFKAYIAKSDVCASHHDYLLAEDWHGSAMFADLTENVTGNTDAGLVWITPDEGYYALVNGVKYDGGYYSLTGRDTVTVSYEPGGMAILDASVDDGDSTVAVNYFATQNAKLIVAVYDSDGLLTASAVEDIAAADTAQEQMIPISCEPDRSYNISVMIWDGMGNIKPLCKPFPVSIMVR